MNDLRIKRATPLEQHDLVRFGAESQSFRVEYDDDDDDDYEVTALSRCLH